MTATQPTLRLGLTGLLLVVPVAWLLAYGAGGAEPSLLVLGPLVTFGLPVIAMVAFWWEDWPGTRLRSSWSGWADTLLIAGLAVVLTATAQAIVERLDLRGIFDPTPGPGHAPTFAATLPLGGAAFVAMLELTLVCEGWPLRRLPPLPAGLAALAVAWIVALAVYSALTGLGALLVLVGAWQVWFFVAWRGWPFSGIPGRAPRLLTANAVVLGGGGLTYVVAHGVAGVSGPRVTAFAGAFVAAGLVLGMLFEGWPRNRWAELAAIVAVGLVLEVVLRSYADGVQWTRGDADAWIAHVGLNAIGVAVILHVGVGRRWPLARGDAP
jgi:hypothetical protein